MQDVVLIGDERRKGLVGNGKLLHSACLDQRWWQAAEGVVLSAEHY